MPKPKNPEKMGFSEAVAEVEDILRRLESEEIDIDELTAEVRRSVELIAVCRAKLDRAEVEVRDFVAGLAEQEPPAAAAPEAAAGESEESPDGGELPF